jgi:U4/U6 small nuclear ribonucleoprotein PRP31
MNKNYSNFEEHDTFMKDLEELSDIEDDDNIFEDRGIPKSKEISESLDQDSKLSLLNNTDFSEFIKIIQKLNEDKFVDFKDKPYFDEESNLDLNSVISNCNNYIARLNSEINLATRGLKSIFSDVFPELTSIVLNPYDYVVTVKSLVSAPDMTKVDLSFLPGNIQLSLNVLISTNSKRIISSDKKGIILKDCELIFQLNFYLKNISTFIENQMINICPNLTGLLGPSIACKLVTSAGGVEELAKIPAGNVLVMGAQRVNSEGFSTKGKLHVGYLGDLDEVEKTPEKFKMQILRKYAGKAVLMARIDAFRKPYNSNSDVKTIIKTDSENRMDGERFKEQISFKMNKIIEPQQAVTKKPLPKPDDKPRKKRGGKRMRSIKEKYALTEMRMMKNRMKFGPEGQIEYRESGEGFGLLGVGGGTGGKMKTSTKAHKFNTKREKMLAMESRSDKNKFINNNEEISGLQSSVAFTPAVGIELINPDLIEKKYKATTDKYFSATSGFSTVINQKKKGDTLDRIYEI